METRAASQPPHLANKITQQNKQSEKYLKVLNMFDKLWREQTNPVNRSLTDWYEQLESARDEKLYNDLIHLPFFHIKDKH